MKRPYIITLLTLIILSVSASAVTSKITRHNSHSDLLKGQTENLIIDSQGTIRLTRQSKDVDLADLLERTWTINTLVTDSDGNIYIGTSPNGMIIKYDGSKSEILYQPEPITSEQNTDDPNSSYDIYNEHIFAMAFDAGGRLLAAVSGQNCRLMRLENNTFKTIYKPDNAEYILSIAKDNIGNIYLGTGPNGMIYRLDPFGGNSTPVYKCRDNNILSLVVDEKGFIYAGSDQRGLVYKIDQNTNTASVLFDTGQKEVTSILLSDDNCIYAAATSALADTNKARFANITAAAVAGRPESESEDNAEQKSSTKTLTTPNSKPPEKKPTPAPAQPKKGQRPSTDSHIYKIDPQGFVTDIFSEAAVFFTLTKDNDTLLLGTGNNAELFEIDLQTEAKSVAYENQTAAQITAITLSNDKIFLGTANPAKLIELSASLSNEGVYISEPVDADQPAQWGKLQLDADIPDGCAIMLATRSGNVSDPNDPTFSEWSNDVEITNATQLDCPIGRYCQYRLTLKTDDTTLTPVIREVAIPHVIPNLPPKITKIDISFVKNDDPSELRIDYTADDQNKDKLTYTLELRQLGRQRWITFKDEYTQDNYRWNTRTVEDGQYEIRITADDKLSNTPMTKLIATRVSEPFVVDNTAPDIVTQQVIIHDDTATLKLGVTDYLTIIGNVSFTVDSNEEWISTIPDDYVYDTTSEDFTIVASDLELGEHIIAVKLTDDIGNTAYKTFVVEIQ